MKTIDFHNEPHKLLIQNNEKKDMEKKVVECSCLAMKVAHVNCEIEKEIWLSL